MNKFSIIFFFSIFFSCSVAFTQDEGVILTGADRIDEWLPMLNGKKVALVANPTSEINGTHIADTLLSLDANLVKVFSPEHGFRGNAANGERVESGTDPLTGLAVVSLYGNHKKPLPGDLSGIDLVIFDLQDVGARFYTYISTLHYVMEACAENDKKLVVLDRPNPNGNYVDGPVMQPEWRSFVGMHPVPVVHGMTMGEYAMMINAEGWLKDRIQCDLSVISCLNYDHSCPYVLPVPPSPNLPDQQSVLLYPSLAFFEGTDISVGRGTNFPFSVYGHPDLPGTFSFTPVSKPGASLNPPHKNRLCSGTDLRLYKFPGGKADSIQLQWLIEAYHTFPDKKQFFNNFFEKLAGTSELRRQIEQGMSAREIRQSWQPELTAFKKIRKKYLLYKDF